MVSSGSEPESEGAGSDFQGSVSEFENFVCSLTGNFVMYIQRLQEQKTTIQNSAKRLETKSKKETKQLELELTQSQELVKEYKELIDDL